MGLSWRKLPDSNSIRTLIGHIVDLAELSNQRDVLVRSFAQKVAQLLLQCETDVAREAYSVLLALLCEKSPSVMNQVKQWLLFGEDERKYNVPVTMALIREGLIGVNDLDIQLSKLIDQGRVSVAEFAVKLIRSAVLAEPSMSSPNQFSNTISSLIRLSHRGKASDSTFQLLEDLGKGSLLTNTNTLSNPKEHFYNMFNKWLDICEQRETPDNLHMPFLEAIQQQGVFRSDAVQALFFRVCIEASTKAYKSLPAISFDIKEPAHNNVSQILALAKLVVLTVRYNELTAVPGTSQSEQFRAILTVIVLVMAGDYAAGDLFDQRPYFNLFSAIFCEIEFYEKVGLNSAQMLLILADIMHTIHPKFLPGFSFAWMSLLSHRCFLPRLLASEDRNVILFTYGIIIAFRVGMHSTSC